MSAHTAGPMDLLAEYFTGPEVTHHSIGLQMPLGGLRERAQRFFELRAAFGISGYVTAEDARAALARATGETK